MINSQPTGTTTTTTCTDTNLKMSYSTSTNLQASSGSGGDDIVDDTKSMVDIEYPGTAVQRLKSVHERVSTLSEKDLSGDWEDVRRKILWAGGLKDLPNSIPGQVST